MKIIDLALPAFAFLESDAFDGNLLKNRTIIQHIRSYTVLEAFHDEVLLNPDVLCYKFSYTNRWGIEECITLAVHFTMSDTDMLPEIFQKTKEWYEGYLDWEDEGIARHKINKV